MSLVATAQSFKQGSIRLKGGEEQAGLLGNIRPGLPDGIEYKISNDSQIQILYASDIEGYTVDNIFYSAFHQNPHRDREWVFVELLAEGELTLIRRNNMYFVRRTGNIEFIHLTRRTQLTSLTRSCPLVSARAGRVGLDRQPLIELIKEYNSCVASKSPNLEGMPRTFSFAVQLGCDVTTGKYKLNADARYLSANKQVDRSFLQGGIELSFKSYRFSNFMGLYTGALWNSNSYSGTNLSTARGASPEVNDYSFSYNEVRIPLGFDISRPTRKNLSLHVRTGVLIPVVLSVTSDHRSREIISKNGNVSYAPVQQIVDVKAKIMAGASIGLDYKISNSYVRVQAGWYSGTVTVVTEHAVANTLGRLNSMNLITAFVF